MIDAIATFWIDCDSPIPDANCHTSIEGEFNPLTDMLEVHEFLESQGWLYLSEDSAYCPACRSQLHDTLPAGSVHGGG
jgi:hypothetical protein